MSTKWHPYTQPPPPMKTVRLRFGDDGERDCEGFYSAAFGSYYKGEIGAYWHSPFALVHPTHWAEIGETQP